MPLLKPAVFLDRDGTINVEKSYLHKIEDFEFIPGAPESIRILKEAGYLVIVVTNQSGVGRGYYSLAEVERLHEHIQQELFSIGTAVDAFYICPHHPTEGTNAYRVRCSCRKPEPGMILQAAQEHGIDLEHSYVVGDKVADISAARSAGCVPLMVRTGYGAEENKKASARDVVTFDTINEAANFIVGKHFKS